MLIPRDTIELIRERAQIDDIVRKYVPTLKKRGNNYIALCPFHKEKTPSFTVSPEKQIFYCFGCHIGGNVYSFISKIERLSFPESVRFVGDIIGIKVESESHNDGTDKFNKFKKINLKTLDLYHKTIKSKTGREGFDYLLNRGVSESSIEEFKLGFSPDSWRFLTNYYKKMNIPVSLPFEIGLVGVSEKNGNKNYYDRFRNRVIFPIFNKKNEVIAFGGRIIGDGEPKYLNSSESILFKKRNELYGLNIAKENIIELDRAIVVEGYLDVIGCHQSGINNVVAPLGTALTLTQIRLLSRFCSEIILLFDADSAGIKASLKSLETLEDISVDAKIAVLPEGDPFEFIKKKGKRELMAVVDSSLKPIDFKIGRAIADYGRKDRLDILLNVFKIINEIKYETEKNVYLKKVSSFLEIDEKSIREDYKKFSLSGNKSETISINNVSNKESIDFLARSHRELMLLLCDYPELLEKAIMDFSADEFSDSISRNIFRKLTELFASGENISMDRMFDFFSEGEENGFLEENLFRDSKIDNHDEVYTQLYLNIRVYQIDQKINHYIDIVKNPKLNKNCDVNKYITEIEVLRREKEKLSPYVYNKIL